MSVGSVLFLQEEGILTMLEISFIKGQFSHGMEHLGKREYNSYWKTKFGVNLVLVPPENHVYRKISTDYKS
jgi:hypothetical protein